MVTDKVLREKYGYVPKEGEQWMIWRDVLVVVHPDALPRMYYRTKEGVATCKVITL